MATTVKDLVYSMTVNPQNAAASMNYKGQTYYFCSALCKAMFERGPGKYVKSEETKSE